MATKLTKPQLEKRVKELEAQIAKKGTADKAPGWHEDIKHDPQYETAKRLRVLESKNGNRYHVMWIAKQSKGEAYLDCQIDLRFGNYGKPIPGFGGDREKWATLDEYFQCEDYRDDRAAMLKLLK